MIRSSFGRTLAALACFLVSAVPAAASSDVVARIGDETITLEQLEKEVRAQLIDIDNMRYEALKNGLDSIVGERLVAMEAKERGVTPEALLESEVQAALEEPTEEEIQHVFDASKQGLGDATLEKVRPDIVKFLAERQRSAAVSSFVDTLRAKYKPKVLLEAPKVDVATGDLAPRGPANAPITIIAFSDYECPFCKRAEDTVDEVLAAYGDKVRYFHRDFPLDFHANARPAASAARCANEQGKFWAYRAGLFDGGQLSATKFGEIADKTGLDRKKFDECVAANRFNAAIDRDMDDGASVGVNGTPAFFVNGRMLSGAQPLEAFKAAIDAELADLEAN
jgi:protein-disulfide isomerase